jgi:hypothetical protein
MGVILTGIVAAAIIAIGAGFYMRSEQEPAWEVFSTSSTRVGDPGQNLVGPRWTGDPDAEDAQAEETDAPA